MSKRSGLKTYGYKVWLDEAEIFVGDSLRGKIEEGLAHSKYGVDMPVDYIRSKSVRELHFELCKLQEEFTRNPKRVEQDIETGEFDRVR